MYFVRYVLLTRFRRFSNRTAAFGWLFYSSRYETEICQLVAATSSFQTVQQLGIEFLELVPSLALLQLWKQGCRALTDTLLADTLLADTLFLKLFEGNCWRWSSIRFALFEQGFTVLRSVTYCFVAAAMTAFDSSGSVLAFSLPCIFVLFHCFAVLVGTDFYLQKQCLFLPCRPCADCPVLLPLFALFVSGCVLRFSLDRTRTCHVPFCVPPRFLIPFASFARRLPGCRLFSASAVFGGFDASCPLCRLLPPVFLSFTASFCLFSFLPLAASWLFFCSSSVFTSGGTVVPRRWATTAGVEKRASRASKKGS